MSHKSQPLNPPPFFMRAVIICDDFAFTENVTSTLARVGSQIAVNVQWITNCWPINALNDTRLAKSALAQASDAHLIVFPARLAVALSPAGFDWLRRWVAGRTIQHAAIGVINVGNDGQLADDAFSKLATFAREHSLGLLVDDDRPTRNTARVADRFWTEREVAFPFAQTYLAGLGWRQSYRGFGINE